MTKIYILLHSELNNEVQYVIIKVSDSIMGVIANQK